MGVSGQHHALAALRPGRTWYPLSRRLGEPQGRSGQVPKISSPLGYDPQTIQPVASRYTDWAIPAYSNMWVPIPVIEDMKPQMLQNFMREHLNKIRG
jgi:hypothetical protein